MYICFLGPEGSGKGTQADLLARRLGIPHIIMGEIFMQIMQEDSELGHKVKAIREAGKYVDDATVIAIFKDRILQADCQSGFIADGYPRSVDQAKALDTMLADMGKALNFAILLQVSEAETLSRLSKRGRFDDTPENIKARLASYNERADAMIAYFKARGTLITIDAEKPIAEIETEIAEGLHL